MKVNLKSNNEVAKLFSNPKIVTMCRMLGGLIYSDGNYNARTESILLEGIREIISKCKIQNMRRLLGSIRQISEFLENNEAISDKYFELGEDFDYVITLIEEELSSAGKKSIKEMFQITAQRKKILEQAQETLTNKFLDQWQYLMTDNQKLGLSVEEKLALLKNSANSLLKVAKQKRG